MRYMLIIFFFFPFNAFAAARRPDSPQRDVVQPGDMLYPGNPVCQGKKIILSSESVGEALGFRRFRQTCFALFMRSNPVIHLLDVVTNP